MLLRPELQKERGFPCTLSSLEGETSSLLRENLLAYNAQFVAEPELQLVVGQAVTRAANDEEQVAPNRPDIPARAVISAI
jgi:hypothetical protein